MRVRVEHVEAVRILLRTLLPEATVVTAGPADVVVRERGPVGKEPTVVLFWEPVDVAALVRHGAAGIVSLRGPVERIAGAIRAAALGYGLDPETVRAAIREAERCAGIRAELADLLTPAECRALALVAQGLSNREIAERLGITPGSAKNLVSNMLARIGARNRVEAALVWLGRKEPALVPGPLAGHEWDTD